MAGNVWDEPRKGYLVGGRFLLTEVIGRGAQSVVWLARDGQDSDRLVAVKILSPQRARPTAGSSVVRPSDLLRMRHEAAALSTLGHPAIVGLVHAGIDGDSVYLALEYCPGPSLEDMADAKKRPEPRQVAAWGRELCDALALAHDRSILHRDIKPANVVIHEGRVKLLDFGMARVRGLHSDLDRGVILGTLPYLSLEAWGMGSHDVDGRSDIYALGATLFEVLVGRRAFAGVTPAEILESHRAGDPRDPCRLDPRVPRPLGDVVLRAMAREPQDRYRSASAMGEDLKVIAEGRTRPFVLGRKDHTTRIAVPRHVGRRAERKVVLDAVDRAALGVGGVVLVESAPGGGRSRFIGELCEAVRAHGALVLAGRCDSFGHDIPYDAAMQALAHFQAQLPLLSDRDRKERTTGLRELLGGRADPLLTLAPKLGEALGESDGGGPRRRPGVARFTDVLRDALLGTAVPGRPTVILLDDVDRADPATQPLLLDLAEAVARHPVVLLLTASAGDTDGTCSDSLDLTTYEFLSALVRASGERLTRVFLPPLDSEETVELVASMLGTWRGEVDVLGRWVHSASGGNPTHSVQLVRSLEEVGAIELDGLGGRIRMERVDRAKLPKDLADGMRRRLAGLDPRDRRVLGAAATLGNSFRTDQLIRVLVELGERPTTVMTCLDRAFEAGLIVAERDAGGGRAGWRFPHQQTRSELTHAWPLHDRPMLHAAAARVLAGGRPPESLDDARLFAVAHHALRAPDRQYALPLALHAADRAMATCAWRTARRLFRVVARRAVQEPERRLARLGEARALLQLGRTERAVEILGTTLEAASSAVDRAEILILRAKARRGRSPDVGVDLREAAKLLGEAWPTDDTDARRQALGALLRNPVRLFRMSVAEPRVAPTRTAVLRRELTREAGRLYGLRRPALTLVFTVRELTLALAQGDAVASARAAAQLAAVLACDSGRVDLSRRLLAQAKSLLGEDAGPVDTGLVQAWGGTVHFFAGDLREARSGLGAGVMALEAQGALHDPTGFRILLGLTLCDSGDLSGFRAAMEACWPGGKRAGSAAARASLGLAWDAFLCGDADRALDWAGPALEAARKDEDWPLVAIALGRRARMLARAGLRGSALVDARELNRLVRDKSMRGWFAAVGLTEAARACVEAGHPEEARRTLPSARAVRGYESVAVRREAVEGLLALEEGRGAEKLRGTAQRMQRRGLRFDAAELWAELHRRTGRTGSRQESARALAGCAGASGTSLSRRLGEEAPESDLQQSARRLAARLAAPSASPDVRVESDAVRRQTVEATSERSRALISTWLSDRGAQGVGW